MPGGSVEAEAVEAGERHQRTEARSRLAVDARTDLYALGALTYDDAVAALAGTSASMHASALKTLGGAAKTALGKLT